jgi:hypothetical protein
LFAATPGGPIPTVTIGGVAATTVTVPTGTTNTLTAVVAAAPTGYFALQGTVDVTVSTPLASPITAREAITIIPDKLAITKVEPQPVKQGEVITVTGALLLTPGTPPGTVTPGTPPGTSDPGTTAIGGVSPSLAVSGTQWPVTVQGAYSDSQLTLLVGAPPDGLATQGTSGEATLTLTRGNLTDSEQVGYELI